MYAIPLRFLPHSCTLITEHTPDIWGKCIREETALSNVRFDLSLRDGNTGAIMFFDIENSTPSDVNFSLSGNNIKRQFIEFDGNEYKIIQIDYLYAGDFLHHLELTLGEYTDIKTPEAEPNVNNTSESGTAESGTAESDTSESDTAESGTSESDTSESSSPETEESV
jgi:hypothetical protein